MLNILLVWNRMGGYHFARRKALMKLYGSEKVFTADIGSSDQLYKWNKPGESVNHFILSDKSIETFDFFRRLYSYWMILKKYHIRYVCLAGYGSIDLLGMIILGKIIGKKIILFYESWYEGNFILDFIKSSFLKIFIDGFFASGIRAKRFLHSRLMIRDDKIITGYSVVDNHHFSVSSKEKADTLHERVLSEIQNFKPYVLCVARYSPEKNLKHLIRSYLKSEAHSKFKLVIIGTGVEKSELILEVGNNDSFVFLTGWKSYEELPYWYQMADFFILPSIFEPWGLVVNEAMAAQRPVIVSENCGCIEDLVDESNGFTFDPGNISALKDILNKICYLSNKDITILGNNSLKKIQYLDVEYWSKQLLYLVSLV